MKGGRTALAALLIVSLALSTFISSQLIPVEHKPRGMVLALKHSFNIEDYKGVTQQALSNPQLSALIGSGEKIILFRIGTDATYVKVSGNSIVDTSTSSLGSPDFTITASSDALIDIINSGAPVSTLKCFLSSGAVTISASDFTAQAEIRAAIAGGLASQPQLSEGSSVLVDGMQSPAKSFFDIFTADTDSGKIAVNKCGAPVGFLPPKFELFSHPPTGLGIYFNKPPGLLSIQNNLIYDNVENSNNLIVGPRDILRINPGLIGPNQILAANPGLIGPADMALINNNLQGPAQFAYLLGIGAHSYAAQRLQSKGLLNNNPFLGSTNRWGLSIGGNKNGGKP